MLQWFALISVPTFCFCFDFALSVGPISTNPVCSVELIAHETYKNSQRLECNAVAAIFDRTNMDLYQSNKLMILHVN